MKKLYASAALLLAAIIWGFAFVAQTVGMDHVGPFTFQSSRYLLGALTLVPVILVSDSRKKKAGTYREMTQAEKKTPAQGRSGLRRRDDLRRLLPAGGAGLHYRGQVRVHHLHVHHPGACVRPVFA